MCPYRHHNHKLLFIVLRRSVSVKTQLWHSKTLFPPYILTSPRSVRSGWERKEMRSSLRQCKKKWCFSWRIWWSKQPKRTKKMRHDKGKVWPFQGQSMFFFSKCYICFSRDTNGVMLSELFCLHIVVGADLSNRFPDVSFAWKPGIQIDVSWILLAGPPKEESTESNDVLGIDWSKQQKRVRVGGHERGGKLLRGVIDQKRSQSFTASWKRCQGIFQLGKLLNLKTPKRCSNIFIVAFREDDTPKTHTFIVPGFSVSFVPPKKETWHGTWKDTFWKRTHFVKPGVVPAYDWYMGATSR